jgi:hypothetical protein
MFKVELRVGRLIEITATPPTNAEDVEGLRQKMQAIFSRRVEPAVTVCDVRRWDVASTDDAGRLVSLMREDNPHLIRSGFIADPAQVIVHMQLDRMIRETNNPNRRLFTTIAELTSFLDEVLTPAERFRLATFLDR